MKTRQLTRVRAATVAALVAGTLALPAQSALAAPQPADTAGSPTAAVPTPAITVADLADSSKLQQRWISEPNSRIALNPSHSQTDDTNPKPDNGLDTMFYADQRKLTADGVIRNSFTVGDAPAMMASPINEGDQSPLFHDTFGADAAQQWPTAAGTGNGAVMVAGPNGATVTLPAGRDWGSVARQVTLNVDTDPILIVTVPATTGQWALKVGPQGGGDILIQNDTAATGTFAYDLKALGVPNGAAAIKLFASHNGTATFKELSIHAKPAVSDNFSDLSGWRTNVGSNNGATISPAPSGLGATVTSTSSEGFGAVGKTYTVNLTTNPILTIAVGQLSSGSQWAMKLAGANGEGDFAIIQNDTNQTGVFSYNLATMTGRTGEQTFTVKLFSTKTPTPTRATFTRLAFHPSTDWLQSPTEYTNTWNPQSLDWQGTYGAAGSYATQDVFVDDNTVSRLVRPAASIAGKPTLTGNFTTAASWDASAHALSVATDGYTRAVGFPADAQVRFYDTANGAAQGAGGTSTPTASSRAWVAVLPNNSETAIGLGYAYGTTTAAKGAAVSSAADGTKTEKVKAALSARTAEWNAYLAKVPAVQDYSLHAVSAEGTTPEDIRAIYYRAFVSLKQTVVPPQPESGISHYQVATGKAATYNGGSSRNRASASWDSLLGIQYLAYTEPNLAWDSLIGMLADVEPDGGLNGESLPSRKAQTAWMLYSVTGDKQKLAEVYPAVKSHMDWSSKNLAWNIYSHYPGPGVSASEERDAEFVVSLAIDLDYAAESARTLGFNDDATAFERLKQTLTEQYEDWFFMPNGKAVQYYWTSKPDATYTQRKGTANYVGTALHLDGLSDASVAAIMARFDEEYVPTAQFAGTAADASKAPDAQFVGYGLLEHNEAVKAQVFLEATLRDITRTHEFSEVYQAGKNGAGPISRGESPTTFGMAQVIDNLWIMNGYRSDEGTPTFVQLPQAAGGVSGLTYLGRSLNVDLTGSEVILSGDAAAQPGICKRIDTTTGVVFTLKKTCGDITLSSAAVKAGQSVTLNGSNFEPNTKATVELHSDPILLAEQNTAADGTLQLTATIPANAPLGEHTIVVTANGITASAPLTVTAADEEPATGGETGGTGDGSTGNGSTGNGGTGNGASGVGASQPGSLASTGVDGVPLAGALLALALLAIGALALTRRKRASVTAQ